MAWDAAGGDAHGRPVRRGDCAWRLRNWCFPACSRPATCISAIISAPSSASSSCRTATTASIASSTCMRSRSGRIPTELPKAIREVTAAFIACGIDPKKHIVFNQSQVAEHAELAWVFNCVARLGWLNRMTQFKEKAGKDRENASVGLYAYPTLMAADILVYRATHVPVGEDQKQHLELSRDIAQKFNNDFAAIDPATRLWRRLVSAAGAADHRRSDARHVAARRREENVEVGRFRLFPHQSQRRRRRHRAENPQGQNRSGAAAERGERPRRRGPKPTIWSASSRRLPTPRAPTCSSNSAARSSRPSRRRWSIWRSPSSVRSARR